MALRFAGTHDFNMVSLHRFERVAKYLGIEPKLIKSEVTKAVENALEFWPDAAPALLGEERAAKIIERLATLRLVKEVLG